MTEQNMAEGQERDAFEQFVEDFDTAVEPTNELETEPEVVPEEPVAEETPVEAAPPPPEPAAPPVAPTAQSAPAASPDLTGELAKLREEISRLREPTAAAAQQPAETYDSIKERAYGELEKVYRPPEAEMENFISDPGPAMARMAARLHIAIVENVAQLVQQQMAQLPSVVEQQNLRRRQEETFWQKFDGRWPKLREVDEGYRQKAAMLGAAYRQLKPAASEADFVEQVGAQLSMLLGVVPSQPQAPAASQPVSPTRPVSARSRPGNGPGKPATAWDALAREFEADDQW